MKILIVEDQRIIANDIAEKVKGFGHQVVSVVSSGEQSIEQAARLRPDLVLMDIHLSGEMDGVEACEEIHSTLKIPIVFLTAFSDRDTVERAKLTGPFGYLVKPFNEKELYSAIEIAKFKHEHEKCLVDKKNWFSATLNCIGDAVIATDTNEAVTFMNPVAQSLTGWNETDALGKPLAEIFKIFDPETGNAMESPLTKALKKGIPFYLTDDPVQLISKDQKTMYVGDSGAPIIDMDGNISGGVLVFQDITRRVLAEKKLRQLNAELEKSNQTLHDFAFTASHDLQAPLRTVLSFADLLEGSADNLKEVEKNYLEKMCKAAIRMQELIDGLLIFADIQAKEKPYEATDLEKIVSGVILDLEIIIQEKGAVVEFQKLPTIEADSLQMRQLFQNLICNGLKFHKEGVVPEITLNSRRINDGFWEISVEDNGVGFNEKYIDKIFMPLERLHKTSEFKGSGLGLAVCKNIVELHGGKITAKSPPGKSAIFIVTLPEKQ